MFGGEFSYQLCSSLWFDEVVLIVLMSYYIYLVCYMPRLPLVGVTPSKFSLHIYVLLDFISKLYAHIKGEFSLLIELGEFIHTIF